MGLPGIRHSIGLARWWHFSLDTIWLLNGIVFYVLLFSTGQWQRLVPTSWSVFPHAVSTAIQYASLASPLTLRYPRLVQHVGRRITGGLAAVFEHAHPRAECDARDISPYFWPNGTEPASEAYARLRAAGFRSYRLQVGGQRVLRLSRADLRQPHTWWTRADFVRRRLGEVGGDARAGRRSSRRRRRSINQHARRHAVAP